MILHKQGTQFLKSHHNQSKDYPDGTGRAHFLIYERLAQHEESRNTRHAPGAAIDPSRLGDPVVLARAPFRLTFAYAGNDRVWKSTWIDAAELPASVRMEAERPR